MLGRTSGYTVRNTWWYESYTAHPGNAVAEYRAPLTFFFPHGDASPLPLFIEASRGTCRTSSVCGDAPENDLIEGDLIEGDVGACLSNPF